MNYEDELDRSRARKADGVRAKGRQLQSIIPTRQKICIP